MRRPIGQVPTQKLSPPLARFCDTLHRMPDTTQSFKNHARLDPAFHFFLVPGGLIVLITTVTRLVNNPGWITGVQLFGAIWAIVAIFKIRLYALKVQDRVIRLEEQLRLKEVLAPPLAARIGELSVDQLIGLRFGSSPELPGLVEKALASHWDRKQIKAAVQNWRPDTWRV